MATPTRSQVVSTPKNSLTTTPNRPHASPRPNLGAIGIKQMAGKSPAGKTPASVHNYTHGISVSSQQASTPLAASMLQEDILNMSTPSAALMASLGPTGLTPLPATQDGLGINHGLSGAPSTTDGHGSKNPQKERHDRLKEMAQVIRKQARGRGVSRDSIIQLAKVHGFDTALDEDTNSLNVVGSQSESIDLEIAFDATRPNAVVNASLKLNLQGEEEGIPQEDASQVLLDNLTVRQHETLPWHDLNDFSQNLEYLNHLESIEQSQNCFKVIDNLYDTFQSIWIAEKKRMRWRHDLHHSCQSNVGEPKKDRDGRLGLRSRYWTTGLQFYSGKPNTSERTLQQDGWTAVFSVEAGPPAIPASQQWLAEEPLVSTARVEDIFQESSIDRPSWQDPILTTQKVPAQIVDSMDVDQPDQTKMLNIHFTSDLEPTIMLPLQVAQRLNQQSQLVDLYQERLITFQRSLLAEHEAANTRAEPWVRVQHIFDKDGTHHERSHAYTLHTGPQLWVHPVNKMRFSHPQQFADALPSLRQYALINTLLQSITPPSTTPTLDSKRVLDSATTSTIEGPRAYPIRERSKTTKRSNKPALESKLNTILNPTETNTDNQNKPLAIDITLDPISSPTQSCRIKIIIPLSSSILSRATLRRLNAKAFLTVNIEVALNGIVEILDVDGIDIEKEKTEDLKKRLARIVRASESLGVIVEWLLRELESDSPRD